MNLTYNQSNTTSNGASERSGQSGLRGMFAGLTTLTVHRGRVIWISVVGILAVVVFGLLIKNTHFDLAVVQYFNGFHHGTIGSLTNAVYKFFGPAFAIIGTVVLTGVIILLTRSLRVASTFAVTIAATWLSLAAVKIIVDRLRPDPALLPFPFNPAQIDASYPSGHTAFITALVVTIFLGVAIRYRWVAAIIGGLVIAGVGLSLIIDGVHYPSDVAASILWGIAVAPLARFLWVSVVLRRFRAVPVADSHGVRPRG